MSAGVSAEEVSPPLQAPSGHAGSLEALQETQRQIDGLLRQGRLREALPLLEGHLSRLRDVLGPRHPRTQEAMLRHGNALMRAGRAAEAVVVLRDAMESIGSAYGERHPSTLVADNDYSLALLNFGDAGAEEALERFERLRRVSSDVRGPRDPETLTILNNYALALAQRSRSAEAMTIYRQVARDRRLVLGAEHPLTLQAASNVAMQHLMLGDAQQAASQLEAVLASEIAALGERDPETLRTMGGLALALGLIGRKDEALRLREHIFRLQERATGELPPAGDVLGLVQALEDLGRIDDTLPLLERFIARAERERQEAAVISSDAQQSLFALHLMGYVRYAGNLALRQRVPEAFAVVERTKARGLIDRVATAAALDAGAVPAIDASRLRDLSDTLSEIGARLALAADADTRERLRTGRAAVARELSELQTSLKQRHPRFRQMTELSPASAADARRLLGRDSVFVSYVVAGDHVASYTLGHDGGLRHQAPRQVPGLGDAVEAFRLLHASPGGGRLRDGEGAPLLAWRWTVDGGPRWKVIDERVCMATAEGRPARAPKTAERPSTGAQERQGPSTIVGCPPAHAQVVGGREAREELARWLGGLLLEPLGLAIAGKRRIVVSPDGPLALLPFDLLAWRERRLVETHDVALVHSLSVLKLLKERLDQYAAGPPRQALLAMGNPVYEAAVGVEPDASAGTGQARARRVLRARSATGPAVPAAPVLQQFAWEELPWTALEIDGAVKLFADRGAQKFERRQASEQQLRQLSEDGRLATFRYLLFSAHGYFDITTPAASALVLARDGPEPSRDGLVTLAEWPALRLRSDLVILSACDTGRGAVVSGEGLVGLGYALYVAGNVNTLLTLWPIADEATAAFMSSYLRRVKSGLALGAALSATKREFLRHPNVAYRDPFYWAAFVINGV